MGAMDRTAEFRQILQQLGDTSGGIGKPQGVPEPKRPLSNRLYVMCGEVGKQLEEIRGRVQELSKIAKKKAVFDDKSAKADAMMAEITAALKRTDDQIRMLSQECEDASRNTSSRNEAEATKNLVESLKIRSKDVMTDFFRVCEERNRAAAKQHNSQQRLARPQAREISGQELFGMGEEDNTGLISGQAQHGGLYTDSRASSMKSVNKTIQELATMFKKMSDLVEQQGQQIMRIDNDMDHVMADVEAGEKDLLKYLNNISGNRKLILKVFGIIIAFVIFFIVFLS